MDSNHGNILLSYIDQSNDTVHLPYVHNSKDGDVSVLGIRHSNPTIFRIKPNDYGTVNVDKLASLYNLRVYIQILALVGGTSRRRVSSYKREYLYIHEYL